MERNWGVHGLLAFAPLFDLFQALIGANKFKCDFVRGCCRTRPEDTVLDVGCGTGVLTNLFPECRYTGIDLNANYIRKARKRGLPNAEFVLGDCIDIFARLPSGAYDHVIIVGVLHHLDTNKCKQLLAECARVLRVGGHLVGLEPAWVEGQSRLERFMMACDRGDNILAENEWRHLFESVFEKVTMEVRHGALRIPYSLLAYECRAPRRKP